MPALIQKPIDSKGHWLRPDAADSFLRMVAAAGTSEGLVVGGRTYAEQKRLHNLYLAGKGNLAAPPGTSLHESGLAVDVTRRSPLQLWMTKGGDPMKVTSSGSIRANEYGWCRTVPSEAWHFRYYPERDKHRPVVKPTPVLLPTLARVATLNCHGWNVPKQSWSARERASILAEIARLGCSVYALTECPEYMRDAIRGSLPGGAARWRVATRGDGYHQAVLFDNTKWKFGGSDPIEFGPTPYHGGLWVTLTQTTTKATVAVGAYHLPPNVVASGAAQVRYLRAFLAAAPKVKARIAGGDGADASSWAEGWQDARIIASTSSNRAAGTYGKTVKDRIFMLGATVRRYTVGPVIAGSDHRSVLAQITIPATITTN